MGKQCCAPGYNNGYGSTSASTSATPTPAKVSLHHIPKNEELRLKWLRSIPRKDQEPKSNSVVCSDYFKEDDYQMISKDKNKWRKRDSIEIQGRHLKSDAIPSIFLNIPSYLSKSLLCCIK